MDSSPLPTPRIGLVGAVGYAQIYLDFLLPAYDAGRLKIAAVAVIPEHQSLPVVAELRKRGAVIYSTWEELVEAEAGKLDLCFIPTGIHWHARMTTAALRAGAQVLVEKPLAGCVKDANAVCDCEQETGRWVAVGFQDIYADVNLWLKRQLVDGKIGKIKSVSMLGLWPRPHAYYTRNRWAGRLVVDGAAAMDSPLNNAFAHFINLGLFFAGPALRQSADAEIASAELFRAHDIESFDTAVVRARSPEGVDFWFGVGHACEETRQPEIRIVGEKGTAEWFHESHCVIHTPEGDERREIPDIALVRSDMFEAVLSKLQDPSTPVCDTSIAIKHTAFIEKLHAHGIIHPVTPGMVHHINAEGDANSWSRISGVEEAMLAAFEQRTTLAAAGFHPELVAG